MKTRLIAVIILVLTMVFQITQAQSDVVYGLNFVGSSLQFASMDLSDGSVEIISDGPISPDAFSQGVADFDPFSKTYFYIRGSFDQCKIYAVDALTGEVIHENLIDNPFGAVMPITNIAYNWMDETIYGVSHEYSNGQDQLKFVSVDPTTGDLTFITDNPISASSYAYGNSDIDPIHRKYYYEAGGSIYVVDLDTGETQSATINFPSSQTQYFVNIAYNWLDHQLYGLQFLSIPDPNPFDNDYYTSELRLATIDVETGDMAVLSNSPTSNDGFSMGDCDIDPVNNRYFYIRTNQMHIVDLTTGDIINIIDIENNNNAVAPIINMAYDDLAEEPPLPLPMNMGDDISINLGESIELKSWVGDNASYLWNDGSTEANRVVSEAGTYSVEINRGVLDITASVTISTEEMTTELEDFNEIEVEIYPNPNKGWLKYELPKEFEPISIQILDINGKICFEINVINTNNEVDLPSLNSGIYYIQFQTKSERIIRPFINE